MKDGNAFIFIYSLRWINKNKSSGPNSTHPIQSLRLTETIGAASLEARRRRGQARLRRRPVLHDERRRHAHDDVELEVAVQVPHPCLFIHQDHRYDSTKD